MREIKVKNTGPVEHVSIPIPERGGVVVLRGRNGIGKSNTLNAVQAAVSGTGSLQVRDGALRGEVEGLGIRLMVGKTTRRAGELTVLSIEGRMSIADIVDPGLKTDDAADAKRIRALVAVVGSSATPEAFYRLMGSKEEFLDAVSLTALEGDDWLVMADRIKRDLEKTARKIEDEAARAEGAARGVLETLPEEPQTVVDPSDLQEAFKLAVLEHSALQERIAQASQEMDRKAKAQAAMQQTPDQIMDRIALVQSSLLSQKQAIENKKDYLEQVRLNAKEIEDQIAMLQSRLVVYQSNLRELDAEYQGDVSQLANDQRYLAQLQESHKSAEHLQAIASVEVPVIDPSLLVASQAKADEAKRAIERAAVVAKQEQDRARAMLSRQESLALTKKANDIRSRAKMVDEILSEQVAKSCKELRVQAGRLVLDTHRGETYFSDLSRGEKYKLAIDIAVNHIGEGGLIVLPQEAWEGCDENVQKLIIDHAFEKWVTIVTAKCSTDDCITTEVYEGHTDGTEDQDGPSGVG